jgi:hypothetical protein
MSMNLCDIRDRAMVFHPNEIKAMWQAAVNADETSFVLRNGTTLTLEDWHEQMAARWNRAVATSDVIESYQRRRATFHDGSNVAVN